MKHPDAIGTKFDVSTRKMFSDSWLLSLFLFLPKAALPWHGQTLGCLVFGYIGAWK